MALWNSRTKDPQRCVPCERTVVFNSPPFTDRCERKFISVWSKELPPAKTTFQNLTRRRFEAGRLLRKRKLVTNQNWLAGQLKAQKKNGWNTLRCKRDFCEKHGGSCIAFTNPICSQHPCTVLSIIFHEVSKCTSNAPATVLTVTVTSTVAWRILISSSNEGSKVMHTRSASGLWKCPKSRTVRFDLIDRCCHEETLQNLS